MIVAATVLALGCGTSVSATSTSSTSHPAASASGQPSSSASKTSAEPAAATCGSGAPPARYRHVVVVMEENRRWPAVGGPGFTSMPYLHGLAQTCAYYTKWNETDAHQGSLSQYIGLTSGVDNRSTSGDCAPSATCRSLDNNIFRQVRAAGGTTRSYVEGAHAGCSAAGNAARHVPALYYYGGSDHPRCNAEVRPFTEFDPNHLPTFAMITPNLCNDGHNCGNAKVDSWLSAHLGAILRGADYRSGTTAVFVVYDEDRPVPNLLVAPAARRGPITAFTASHNAALRTWEQMLGLPALPAVRTVTSLRASAHV